MLFSPQLLFALACLLPSFIAAEDPDGVWGWPSFTPADGYVGITFPARDNTNLYAYIDETYQASKIERAVIQLHGHGRDCWNYAKHTSQARDAAASTMGLDSSTILSIAPEFLGVGDLNNGAFKASDRYLCWLGDEWSGGADNVEDCTPGSTGISSLDALDAIVSWLHNRTLFPALNTIVVSGHSLGGQMVHRYVSLGSDRSTNDVEMHYWIGNPASYLYLNDARPAPRHELQECPEYDDFKYGLQKLNTNQSYVLPPPSAAQIWSSYVANNVHIALGLADDGSGNLGCEGLVQGKSHLERGIGYMNFVKQWAGQLPAKHTIDYFAGITHNAGKMLEQPASLRRLFFDRGASITPSVAPNGMTNDVNVRLNSPHADESFATLKQSQKTSRLSSQSGKAANGTNAGTPSNSSSSSGPKQPNLHSSGACIIMPASAFLPLFLALSSALVLSFA